jgi:hypothetical protein
MPDATLVARRFPLSPHRGRHGRFEIAVFMAESAVLRCCMQRGVAMSRIKRTKEWMYCIEHKAISLLVSLLGGFSVFHRHFNSLTTGPALRGPVP